MAKGKLFVLGHPVAHSKSPAMHNAAYRALGLDWDYALMDCGTEADARAFLSRRDWLAANVTMPWKGLALRSAGSASISAQLADGANVLVRDGERLVADNTDGRGCVSYLRRCGVSFRGAAAVVCGTGPTSLSIMRACVEAGASKATLVGRDLGRCRAVLESYRKRLSEAAVPPAAQALRAEPSDVSATASPACVEAADYGSAGAVISAADVIVDATPLGMHAGDPAAFDTRFLVPSQVVLDVVYGHGLTRLVADARAAGCRAFDGRGMLVAQAVETVVDIARVTGAFDEPDTSMLFDVMAEAAGFDL